jgi:hypothetical protein
MGRADHTVRVGLDAGKLEGLAADTGGEQGLAVPQQDRVHVEVVLVDQVRARERLNDAGAALDADGPARLLLESADLVLQSLVDDSRVVPVRALERPGEHELGRLVEGPDDPGVLLPGRRVQLVALVVGNGVRPVGREDLVRHASEHEDL